MYPLTQDTYSNVQARMNRRSILRSAAAAGIIGIAGCNNSRNESSTKNTQTNSQTTTPRQPRVLNGINDARTELADAASRINEVVITKDGSIDVQSEDFDGFTVDSVTAHTNDANEELAAVRNSATGEAKAEIELLLTTSTILSQTAKQYTDFDSTYSAIIGYETFFSSGDYKNSMRAAQELATFLAQVTTHGEQVSEALVRIKNSNKEPRVKGFALSKWGTEQSIIIEAISPKIPMSSGLLNYAKSFVHIERASNLKRQEEYEDAKKEFIAAIDALQMAGEKLQTALDDGLVYKRDKIQYYNCHVSGYSQAYQTLVKAMEEYIEGNDSKGDSIYKGAKPKLKQVHNNCTNGYE